LVFVADRSIRGKVVLIAISKGLVDQSVGAHFHTIRFGAKIVFISLTSSVDKLTTSQSRRVVKEPDQLSRARTGIGRCLTGVSCSFFGGVHQQCIINSLLMVWEIVTVRKRNRGVGGEIWCVVTRFDVFFISQSETQQEEKDERPTSPPSITVPHTAIENFISRKLILRNCSHYQSEIGNKPPHVF
jgi:hypothetical protein